MRDSLTQWTALCIFYLDSKVRFLSFFLSISLPHTLFDNVTVVCVYMYFYDNLWLNLFQRLSVNNKSLLNFNINKHFGGHVKFYLNNNNNNNSNLSSTSTYTHAHKHIRITHHDNHILRPKLIRPWKWYQCFSAI